jgi:hypothetical protein
MADFGDEGYDREGGRYEFQGQYNPKDPSVLNGMITPEQWAEYQRQRRRAALIGYLGTVGGMLGAQPLANAIGIGAGAGSAGGGAAGSASGMPAGYVPGWEGNTGIIGGAAGGAAGGAGVGAGAGAGGFGLRDAIGLGLAGAGAIGGAMSDRPDYSPNSATNDPAMQELLQIMAGRLRKSEPLYDSVMAMANGLLPTQYQKGGVGMG